MNANNQHIPLLTFRLAAQDYALAISNVREVAAMLKLETLPDASEAILGIANRQGEILPILDLRRAFKLEAASISVSSFFIVVEHEQQMLGLLVDEVYQVKYFAEQSFKSASGASRFIRHLLSDGERLYQVLNIKSLLESYIN